MKYEIGDRVRIRSKEWYDKYKDECGEIRGAFFDKNRAKLCGTIQTIANKGFFDGSGVIIYAVEDAYEFIGEEAIEGLVEEEALKQYEVPTGSIKIWDLPEGYIFKDENGNVINTTKIVLEKKEYPKTFEECVSMLMREGGNRMSLEQMNTFRKLIDARNAYWKIAGEEMGLGKPWKPDYDSGVDKFGIVCYDNTIQNTGASTNWERHLNKVLDFPTREMRDAFYENFKDLIEQSKELL